MSGFDVIYLWDLNTYDPYKQVETWSPHPIAKTVKMAVKKYFPNVKRFKYWSGVAAGRKTITISHGNKAIVIKKK